MYISSKQPTNRLANEGAADLCICPPLEHKMVVSEDKPKTFQYITTQ